MRATENQPTENSSPRTGPSRTGPSRTKPPRTLSHHRRRADRKTRPSRATIHKLPGPSLNGQMVLGRRTSRPGFKKPVDAPTPRPLSVYVHIPFCEERCTLLGCNVVIAKDRDRADRYIDHLALEMAHARALLGAALAFSSTSRRDSPPSHRAPQLEWLDGRDSQPV